MAEITKREAAVAMAVAGAPESNGSWINDARRLIAMHDALTAYDAAQKPAEPAAPSDPVATVREAMGKINEQPEFSPVVYRERGVWFPNDQADDEDCLGSIILEALPALLERAEQPDKIIYSRDAGRGYREGVIKGLEMAADRAHRQASFGVFGYPTTREAFQRLRNNLDNEADRIRNGGPIDGETGGTTAATSHAAPHAPEWQTQAGGAPGLPEIADALRNIIKVINSAGALNLSSGVQLGPTVWYVKMTDALERGERALASLEADHG